MIALTNKRTVYSVENVNESMKISGNVTISEGKRITDFNGYFQGVGTEMSGNFYYNETEDGRVNKNLSGIPSGVQSSACEFLDSTIDEIKNFND